MTNYTPPEGIPDFLRYEGHPIHIIMHDGVLWFAGDDICGAMGLYPIALSHVRQRDYAPFAMIEVPEYSDDGEEIGTVPFLSPIGVWLLTAHIDGWKHRLLAAWSKREAKTLCPDPRPGDPRMFVTFLADGDMPPKPNKYSGRLSQWLDVQDSRERWEAKMAATSKYIARPTGLATRNAETASAAPKAVGHVAAIEAQLSKASHSGNRRAVTRVPNFLSGVPGASGAKNHSGNALSAPSAVQ